MDNHQEQNNNNNQVNVPDHGAMMAVVSGDSEGPSEDEDIFDTHTTTRSSNNDSNQDDAPDCSSQGDELLYDEKMDDEDETYVYMNLRGGKHDPQSQKKEQASGTSSATKNTTNSPSSLKKPRNSDAIISCPACFATLSMDTQKHCKYHNQYRAMFVMGITVDWQHRLKYDDKVQGLVRWHPTSNSENNAAVVAPDHPSNNSDPIYYATFCANCRTMVAALDMNDEVYHFYDCLASP